MAHNLEAKETCGYIGAGKIYGDPKNNLSSHKVHKSEIDNVTRVDIGKSIRALDNYLH